MNCVHDSGQLDSAGLSAITRLKRRFCSAIMSAISGAARQSRSGATGFAEIVSDDFAVTSRADATFTSPTRFHLGATSW